MTSRAAAKGRRLLFLAAVCLLPALLLSPTAEASRGLPTSVVDLTPPAPRWDAEAPPAPRLDLFHIEDELLVEILTGVEPEHHQALLEHRQLELLPTSAIQKTASGVSTSGFELNVQKGKPLKPDLRWTVPFYAKARFYDPEVGRFLTEDPAEPDLTTPPSLHKYLYAYGNPTRYWDPLGLRPEEPEEELSWAAKAWAWVKSFVGIEDVKDAGDSLHEASQAFDEQVYGRRGSGSSLEEEIARREEHRQGVAETTGIVLENSKEAGTKLATAAVKATDAAGVTGIAKKGGRKLVTEIADTADNRIASRADDVARNKAVPESTQAGTKQADEVSSTTGLEANRWQSNEVLGRRVYQRNDLFDPAQRSSWFDKETNQWQTGTNVERMRAGLAPVDSAGRPIQLHHLTGTEVNGLTGTRGALAEVTETFHQRNAQTLNIARPERNPNIPRQTIPQYPSFRRTTTGERSIEADEFDAFRSAYWIERSKSF